MIEQFVITKPLLFVIPGTRNLDFEKINALSKEEFAQIHLELMTEYKEKDGWWSPDKIPRCGVCQTTIPSPQNLRRYHGRTLDANCFRKIWADERCDYPEGSVMRTYWDRVAQL